MLCNISLNTPIACSLVCFPGMTSSLAKVNKSSGVLFLALFIQFPNLLMFLNIQIDLLILKTCYGQFTLRTKKKSLHIIFKISLERLKLGTSNLVYTLIIASPSLRTANYPCKLSLKGAWSLSRDLFNFWKISDSISKTVRHSLIVCGKFE